MKKERILPGIINSGPALYYPRVRADTIVANHGCYCPFCGARMSRDRYNRAKVKFNPGR